LKRAKILPIFLFAIFFLIPAIACSGDKSPVEPVIDNAFDSSQDTPVSFGMESNNRSVLAVYNAVIDPDQKTFTVEPANRSAEYHYPLTQLYPDVLQIANYGWTPNFWAHIKLTHPFPGSGIDAFDARVVAIIPANPGVSYNFPVLDVNVNNSIFIQPDGYTKLCDWIAPSIPGNANPFMAYFKNQPNRVWSSTDVTEETLRWYMDFSGFGGPMAFVLAVNVSTNYPNPPQPGVDNAHEPVRIEVEIDDGLTPDGGSAEIIVTLLDWQGHDGCVVQVESPEIFNGVVDLTYAEPGPNPNEYIFSGAISNDLLADEGFHPMLVAARDQQTTISLYHETKVHIKEENLFNPVDITPGYLNICHGNNNINGNYLYIPSGYNGLKIFDISDPLSPYFVNMVDTTKPVYDVYIAGDYAYVADRDLAIIDITIPESAHIVNTVDLSDNASIVCVSDGYAYMLCYYDGIVILDIDPPESAYVLGAVDVPGYCTDICISGDYAFATGASYGLHIVDINPPESAFILNSVNTPYYASAVKVTGDYAYVADYIGLQIIKIDPPQLANIVNSVDTPGSAQDVYVTGGYAYVADYDEGLQIINIDPPESAYIVKSVDTPDYAWHVSVSGDYAYIADIIRTQIIDITPPESAYIAGSIGGLNRLTNVCVSNGYTYVTDSNKDLQIINTDPPESAYIVNSVNLDDEQYTTYGLDVSGDYAYLCNEEKGLCILDINPPESAYIFNTVDTLWGRLNNVYVSDGFAYVTSSTSNSDVQICDVDPPESAFRIMVLIGNNDTRDVYVSDGYTYLVGNIFVILDVDIPNEAHILSKIHLPGDGYGVCVSDGYAFVAVQSSGLYIIDVDPPELANIVKTVDTPNKAIGIDVSGGFAYVAVGASGLQIVDIEPIESAFTVELVDTPGIACDVCISDGYAYIADTAGGLRIIDLW
jgi:hypothetical protein